MNVNFDSERRVVFLKVCPNCDNDEYVVHLEGIIHLQLKKGLIRSRGTELDIDDAEMQLVSETAMCNVCTFVFNPLRDHKELSV